MRSDFMLGEACRISSKIQLAVRKVCVSVSGLCKKQLGAICHRAGRYLKHSGMRDEPWNQHASPT